LLKKLKWWIFGGTFTAAVIIIITFLLKIYGQGNIGFTDIFVIFFPICLASSLVIEILNKSESWRSLLIGEIFIGIFEGFLYFLVYWIGYEVIIQEAYKNPLAKSNLGFVLLIPMIITCISIIPGNLTGGFIGRLIGICIKKKK
jgi:hypothetical protein